MIVIVVKPKEKIVYFSELKGKCMLVHNKGGGIMDHAITGATWLLFLVPMPLLIVLSLITFFTERRE
jgi:hypothetical protein